MVNHRMHFLVLLTCIFFASHKTVTSKGCHSTFEEQPDAEVTNLTSPNSHDVNIYLDTSLSDCQTFCLYNIRCVSINFDFDKLLCMVNEHSYTVREASFTHYRLMKRCDSDCQPDFKASLAPPKTSPHLLLERNDIRTLDECMFACSFLHPQCTVFQMNTAKRQCTLWANEIASVANAPNTFVLIDKCQVKNITKCFNEYTHHFSMSLQGKQTSGYNLTFDQCKFACDRHVLNCLGIVWDGQACSLIEDVPTNQTTMYINFYARVEECVAGTTKLMESTTSDPDFSKPKSSYGMYVALSFLSILMFLGVSFCVRRAGCKSPAARERQDSYILSEYLNNDGFFGSFIETSRTSQVEKTDTSAPEVAKEPGDPWESAVESTSEDQPRDVDPELENYSKVIVKLKGFKSPIDGGKA